MKFHGDSKKSWKKLANTAAFQLPPAGTVLENPPHRLNLDIIFQLALSRRSSWVRHTCDIVFYHAYA